MSRKANPTAIGGFAVGVVLLILIAVGIFGSGQAYEALLLRMRAHPLPEARSYAQMMLTELRKVIPSFLRRVDQPDRGVVWSDYLETNRIAMSEFAADLFAEDEPEPVPEVLLTDWDPSGEAKMLAAMLYPYTSLGASQIAARVAQMTEAERMALVERYCGERANRRHRPGRALERIDYRFDVLADYGSFRDLQRHRLLTILRACASGCSRRGRGLRRGDGSVGRAVRHARRSRRNAGGVVCRFDGVSRALQHAVQRP